MEQAEELERPRAVTVIGWVWIILAGVLMGKALLNLLTWGVLQSASPNLLRGTAEESGRAFRFLGPLVRHIGALLACQAVAWAVVGVCAWNLLRLRRWARVAIQVVCWLGLAYATAFLLFWVSVWPKLAARDPSVTESRRTLALALGVGACLLLGAAFGIMAGFLRSSRVRGAFAKRSLEDRPPKATSRSGSIVPADRR